jgi:N-acetylmuramoyl-L-alanine amidase
LAVELGQDLQKLLQVDDRYQVFITRDDRAWDPTFVDYFAKNWNNIAAWEKLARQKMQYLISVGLMTKPTPTIIHDNAPKNVAQRLYGITKWSNENNINVMIHIHFNDYTGRRWNRVGKYSGFAIYVPAPQFSNSSISHDIAQDIYKKLAEHNKVSNFPLEASGIIDEPGLIALGENNTSNAASVLIEYGYIYEKQFTDPKLRSQSLQDLAQQTFSGLQDYFNQNNNK